MNRFNSQRPIRHGLARPAECRAATALVLALLLSCVEAASSASGLMIGGQSGQDVRPLEPGAAVVREIAWGQTHAYRITLDGGEYLRVSVEQRGVNVTVALFGPDGVRLSGMDGQVGQAGAEELSWEAAAGGSYVIEVRRESKDAETGRYEVLAGTKPAATGAERARITAERLLMDGKRAAIEWRNSRDSGVLDGAVESYRKAIPKWREAGDRRWEGLTLYWLAEAYLGSMHHEKGRAFHEQGLAAFREVGDKRNEVNSLVRMHFAFAFLKRSDSARECLVRALDISRRIKDRYGEASILYYLGQAHTPDRMAQALDYYEQSLLAARESGHHFFESLALNNLGSVYVLLKQPERAAEYYHQALANARKHKDKRFEGTFLIGLSHIQLFHFNQPERAREYVEQALAVSRETKNVNGEAHAYEILGGIHRRSNETEKAERYYEQALAIFRATRAHIYEAYLLDSLGDLYLQTKRHERAKTTFGRALIMARELKVFELEAEVSKSLLAYWKELGRPRLAIFYGKQSVNASQEIRSTNQSLEQNLQKSYLKSKEDTYRDLADLLISEGRLPEAEQVLKLLKEDEYFEFIRRDQSAGSRAGRSELTPEEAALDKRYREAADRVAEMGAERGLLLNKKERTPEDERRLAKLDAGLVAAGQAFQTFLSRLENELGPSPDAGAKAYAIRESQGLMEDLREMGHGAVALYTLVGEGKFRVILTTPDVQKGYEYPIKAADLNRKVLAFRESLQNPKLDPLKQAHELYRILIGPVAKDLKAARAQTLMWSLDGVLRYLPIAALHDGEKYVVERYRTTVFTPASQARLKDVPDSRWRALGLGVTKSHGERVPALPGVSEEMRGIIRDEEDRAATYGANKPGGVIPGTIKLDEAFTQEAMLAGLRRRPPVVHVASHFQFRPGDETNSALLLGDGSFLSLAQIKSLPNIFGGVELLTLSACDTATGGGANGKEVEGFGVLAQRQGAKAVVASLWPVADRSTKFLMQEFYRRREAKEGTPKVEALRQAQLKLLRGDLPPGEGGSTESRQWAGRGDGSGTAGEPRFEPNPKAPYAHPYYWAPFILIGNWK